MKSLKLISKNNLVFLLPILSGILLILAYPPYNLGILVFIALIPLLYFVSLKSMSSKKAFMGGILFGVVFFGKLFSWLFATAPFEWLGLSSEKGLVSVLILLSIIWFIQIVFFALFFGIFSWLIKKLATFKVANFSSLIIIPGLWILLEYLRAWGFGILWLGEETLFGPHWTFGNLAYTLHGNPLLIQIADIAGIYGISFLIVLVNVGLFLIWKTKNKRSLIIAVLILLILAWISYGTYRTYRAYRTYGTYKIALLQTNFLSGAEFNPYQRKEVFNTVLGLFSSRAKGSEDKPDFIIAPEGFGIVSLTGNKKVTKYLLKDFFQPGQIYIENEKIIDSPPHQKFGGGGKNQKVKSRLFYYDLEQQEPLAFHDKMLLVPNGGYIPYLTKSLLNIYSFNLNYQERLVSKGEKINVAQTPKGNIGGTICSSILSPNLQRQMTKKGAQFLVVVSSDAPFHGAKALLFQNLAMSKLRAIENRRYFAQATNMGYSFLINPQGKVVSRPSQLGNEILFSDIQLINKKTIYTKFGDWLVILIILLFLFSLTFKIVYNK